MLPSLLYQNRKKSSEWRSSHLCSESFSYTSGSSLNCEALESLSFEIARIKSENLIYNIAYRSADGDMNVCEKHFENILSENLIRNKNVIFPGDFNITVLDFEQNEKKSKILLTYV